VVGSQIACDLLSSSPTVSVRLQQSQEYFAALTLRVRRSCAISVPHLHVPGIEYRAEGHQKIDKCHSLNRGLLGAVCDYVLFKLVINN